MTKIESNVHIVVAISYSSPQRFVLLMVRRDVRLRDWSFLRAPVRSLGHGVTVPTTDWAEAASITIRRAPKYLRGCWHPYAGPRLIPATPEATTRTFHHPEKLLCDDGEYEDEGVA